LRLSSTTGVINARCAAVLVISVCPNPTTAEINVPVPTDVRNVRSAP
jgi:hypothetical protein